MLYNTYQPAGEGCELKRSIRKSVAQQIVETVKDVCSRDINFIDPNGIIFASTNPPRVGSFHEIGRQVVRTGETIEVETDDSFFGTHKGVNLPIRYRGEIIAAIGISGVPEEVRKYAYLAQRITTLILREQELEEQSSSERAQLNYIIRALISGEAIDYGVYMDFIQRYELDPGGEYTAIVMRVNASDGEASLSLIENGIYQALAHTGAKLYTFSYPNEYILLMETERYQKWAYIFRQLAAAHRGVLKIGIGNSDSLTRQDQSYQAARIALDSLIGEENLAAFDQLDLEILLGTIPEGAKQRFLKRTVQDMDEKDRAILRTYFGFGMSLKAASDALFMHKNTLQYQLDRIHRTSGYNPRSFQDAVILYLGLKLYA